jgi:hypothetical protein
MRPAMTKKDRSETFHLLKQARNIALEAGIITNGLGMEEQFEREARKAITLTLMLQFA